MLSLIEGIFTPEENREIQKQFTSLVSMKNVSEYQPDLMIKEDAEKAVKWSERIYVRSVEKLKTSR